MENKWYPLYELTGYPLSSREQEAWQREVELKSYRIQHDLGLRTLPLSVAERERMPSFRATNIAGLLRIRQLDLQIVPKFVSEDTQSALWQMSILTILDRIRRKQFTYSRVHGINIRRVTFIDHIALAYADALEKALNEESIHLYRVREESTPYMRGRLSVARQMRVILSSPQHLQCDVDYLDTDNPLNQLLRWAGERFTTMIFDGQIRRRLVTVLSRLPATTPMRKLSVLPSISLPPQYKHYLEAFEIALLLAKGYGHDQEMGKYSGYGYLLNMEKLFESFIEKSLAHAIERFGDDNYRIMSQYTKLFAEAITPDRSFYTRPDNLLCREEKPLLVIDSKYKILADAEEGTWSKPRNSDIYQLYASAISNNCNRGLLVYPQVLADRDLGDGQIHFWKVRRHEGAPVLLGAVATDISGLASQSQLQQFDENLGNLLVQVLSKSVEPSVDSGQESLI